MTEAGDLVRVSTRVVAGRADEMRARLIAVAPDGFEERDDGDAVVFAVYVAAVAAGAVASALPGAAVDAVPPGWEDAWRAFHRPVVAGGVWIGPPWEVAPAGIPAVVIDPGRAFGTGAHPTTRLCVELLTLLERTSLLDVGCGSGVLSLAAARLGFGPLTAVDSDPVAVEAALANAAACDVDVVAVVADATRDDLPEAGVAVANILLGTVEAVLPRLPARLAITSGYLRGERPAAPGWAHVDAAELEGWAADVFART